jgi:hypothetical protein
MGASCGGLTTKIYALFDAEHRPVRFERTAGQAGDAPTASDPSPRSQDLGEHPAKVDAQEHLRLSRAVYSQRILVERFVNLTK